MRASNGFGSNFQKKGFLKFVSGKDRCILQVRLKSILILILLPAILFISTLAHAEPFIESKKLFASDGAATDLFGYSVSVRGDTAIVGAFQDDDNGLNSGSAYIFYRDAGGLDNWGEVKKITAGDGAADDWFGHSVSISGDTAIVGTHWDSAYIFSRDQGGLG